MKYYYSLIGLLIMLVSCNKLVENHYHDGVYIANIIGFELYGEWVVRGNEIVVSNNTFGTTKIECTQFKDRIEYKMPDGAVKILTVLENGDLKYSEILILEKVKSEEEPVLDEKEKSREIHQVKKKLKNQTQNIDLSDDAYSGEYAIVENIFEYNDEVYIVVDIVTIELNEPEDEYDYSLSYEIINNNPKLRTYKAIDNMKIAIIDHQCVESTSSLKYLIDNKDRIQPVSPFGFVMIKTNKQGVLLELDFGCIWN